MQIGNLEFQVIFAAFAHEAGFFVKSSHLYILLVSVFGIFLHFSDSIVSLLAYSHICDFGMSTFTPYCFAKMFSFSFLLRLQVFSFPFQRQYFCTYNLILSNILT